MMFNDAYGRVMSRHFRCDSELFLTYHPLPAGWQVELLSELR